VVLSQELRRSLFLWFPSSLSSSRSKRFQQVCQRINKNNDKKIVITENILIYARDDVSGKNLFPPILVCNTGQMKSKTTYKFTRHKQSVTTVMKFWSNADNLNCCFNKNVKKWTCLNQSATTWVISFEYRRSQLLFSLRTSKNVPVLTNVQWQLRSFGAISTISTIVLLTTLRNVAVLTKVQQHLLSFRAIQTISI